MTTSRSRRGTRVDKISPLNDTTTCSFIMTRTVLPDQSPKSLPTPLAMSSAPPPTASPIPRRSSTPSDDSVKGSSRPHPKPGIPTPKLRLEVRELNHPGSLVFFGTTNPVTVLSDAVTIVLQTLYTPFESNKTIPPTRSITLVLRSMDGVAYTTGSDLDNDHKEIHFSLDYIASIPSNSSNRQKDEIAGVLVHEMVHAWQWNALGTAPAGLIEGIADFVRLRAGLSPPHWKKESGGDWDAGYQHTGYFLDWLEGKFGEGTVMRINEALRNKGYEEVGFWKNLFGESVESLWKAYTKGFENTSHVCVEKRETL